MIRPARIATGPEEWREARPSRARLSTWAILALLAVVVPNPPAAAQLLPPNVAWYTFDTPNFRITFSSGLEAIARRAAARAESAHALLSAEFLPPPSGRIELVVAGNLDLANGVAEVIPRNRIVAYVHPPASDEHLAYHEDWLDLLILHELAHVFHLEYASGVWMPLRRLFGREPGLFPQVVTPSWIAEGIATYIESEYTGAGRVRGSVFDMILRTATLDDRFFAIDRVTFDPIAWPAGSTRYAYGAFFVDHLARRFGPAAVGDFVRQVGRQIVPYGFDRAARRSFGTTFTGAWRTWESGLRERYLEVAESIRREGVTEPEILSEGGRLASHPRFAPDGSGIVYTAATGRAEASLLHIGPAGQAEVLTPISTLGPVTWSAEGDRMYLTQLEFVGPYQLFSDLHEVHPGAGTRRITRGARLWELDLHPAESRGIAVGSAAGTNVLVLVDPGSGEVVPLTEPSFDTYWAGPRWSPDGERIAVARWHSGGHFDIVVLDGSGRLMDQVTDDRAVDSQPAWSPDGRYIVFSSDRTGIPNLFAYDASDGTIRQVTNVLTGAFQPDVSGDGRWITFSYYKADGYYVARIAFEPDLWPVAPPAIARAVPLPTERSAVEADSRGVVRAYSPWPTILPTRWFPTLAWAKDLGWGVGAVTSGSDVVERHVWTGEILAYPRGRRIDGGVAYRYRGLGNPVIDLRGQQQWRVQAESRPGTGGRPALLRREREGEVTVSWIRRRWRSVGWIESGTDLREVDHLWADREGGPPSGEFRFPLDLGGFVGVGASTTKSYGLSLGPQDGIRTTARVQARRFLSPPEWSPEDRDYWRITWRNQAYRGLDHFGFAPSVLALRADGAIETSAAAPGFTVGGGGGQQAESAEGTPLLARGVAFPVRGFAAGSQGGNRAFSASAEYRFPIVLVERGIRVLPIGANRIWGAVFADAGAAWCPGACPVGGERIPDSPETLASIGAEAIFELRVGYFADLPFHFGVATPVRGAAAGGPQLFLRLGRLF